MLHLAHFSLALRRGDAIVQSVPWRPNVCANEGLRSILATYFQDDTALAPISFEVGLTADAPLVTLTAATMIGEVAGNGYYRQPIGRDTLSWPTLAQDPTVGEDEPYYLDSLIVSFVAQNHAIEPFSQVFLVGVLPGTNNAIAPRVLLSLAATDPITSIPAGHMLDVVVRIVPDPLIV